MIQCRNSGWVGVGFHADDATMKNADIHICRRWGNETWEFIDAYALDVGPPTRDQTLAGGSNNLFDTWASYESGVVTCKFSKCVRASSPLISLLIHATSNRSHNTIQHDTGGSRQRIHGTRRSRRASTR
jgi:hypothetical protein